MYIYSNVCKQMTDVKLLMLRINTWNYLTVCKQMITGLFKNVINKMCLQIKYNSYAQTRFGIK